MNDPHYSTYTQGYQTNNFGHRNVPSNNSNMYQHNGNPFSHFNNMTTNSQFINSNISKFPDNSKKEPLINQIDYTNQNNLLHNNVDDIVLDEHIIEYRINIDSLDRDIEKYPDPFCFTTKFNPTIDNYVRQKNLVNNGCNGQIYEYETVLYTGDKRPHINREFRNIKYIKLDNIILPKYLELELDEDEIVGVPSSNLMNDRFMTLTIPEIDMNEVYSTFDTNNRTDPVTGQQYSVDKPFATIIQDSRLGQFYFSGTPYYGSKVYKNSLLGNLSSLTLKFFDSCGAPLKMNHLLKYDELDGIPLTDFAHPLNKYNQVFASFIIGVVESQINTNTKFEK